MKRHRGSPGSTPNTVKAAQRDSKDRERAYKRQQNILKYNTEETERSAIREKPWRERFKDGKAM